MRRILLDTHAFLWWLNGDKQAGALPPHHHDPFDRMLVAQAQTEGLEILTSDAFFPLYGVRLIDARH